MFVKRRQEDLPNPKNKRSWRIFIWGVAVLFIGTVGWVTYSGVLAIKNATAKNNNDAPLFFRLGKQTNPSNLTKEGESRINALLIGADQAAGLTDTIQILSIDPINNTYSLLSLPRDLAVANPGLGRTKINAVYNGGKTICSAKKSCQADVDPGAVALKDTVEEVTGQEISYFVRTDFYGLKKIVDTLGGIDIYVDKALKDPKYPSEKGLGFVTVSISAGQQKMNGDTALKYARSRQSTSDFDRARRQQQVISAIRAKALNIGTLSNPKKITDLLTILGQHIRTDIQVSEMPRFAELIREIESKNNSSEVLDTTNEGPLRSASDAALGYIIVPKLGPNNYEEVRQYVQKVFQEPYIIKEKATISLKNASNNPALLPIITEELKNAGYNVISSENVSPAQQQTTVYENPDKPFSYSLLKKRLQANLVKNKETTADIEVIIGTSYKK